MTASDSLGHPHDTVLSGGLRFATELIAWIAAPWALAPRSPWLATLAAVVLVALPAVFSTRNDMSRREIRFPGQDRAGRARRCRVHERMRRIADARGGSPGRGTWTRYGRPDVSWQTTSML